MPSRITSRGIDPPGLAVTLFARSSRVSVPSSPSQSAIRPARDASSRLRARRTRLTPCGAGRLRAKAQHPQQAPETSAEGPYALPHPPSALGKTPPPLFPVLRDLGGQVGAGVQVAGGQAIRSHPLDQVLRPFPYFAADAVRRRLQPCPELGPGSRQPVAGAREPVGDEDPGVVFGTPRVLARRRRRPGGRSRRPCPRRTPPERARGLPRPAPGCGGSAPSPALRDAARRLQTAPARLRRCARRSPRRSSVQP